VISKPSGSDSLGCVEMVLSSHKQLQIRRPSLLAQSMNEEPRTKSTQRKQKQTSKQAESCKIAPRANALTTQRPIGIFTRHTHISMYFILIPITKPQAHTEGRKAGSRGLRDALFYYIVLCFLTYITLYFDIIYLSIHAPSAHTLYTAIYTYLYKGGEAACLDVPILLSIH
jgi:hypothetical protein